MAFDPYAELELPRDASPADVKKAYRQRAKATHPDVGPTPDSTKFERVQRAWMVLRDPDRRAKYDRTGDIDEALPDNAQAHALTIVMGFFVAVVAQALGNPEVFKRDLVELAKKNFCEQIAGFEKELKKHERAAEMFRQLEKKLRAKKKANPLLRQALLNQADGVAPVPADLRRKIQAHKDALDLVDGYTFEMDTASAGMTYTPLAANPFLRGGVWT